MMLDLSPSPFHDKEKARREGKKKRRRVNNYLRKPKREDKKKKKIEWEEFVTRTKTGIEDPRNESTLVSITFHVVRGRNETKRNEMGDKRRHPRTHPRRCVSLSFVPLRFRSDSTWAERSARGCTVCVVGFVSMDEEIPSSSSSRRRRLLRRETFQFVAMISFFRDSFFSLW